MEERREERREENTFRKTVLFVVGFVVIGLFGLLVLAVELPFAIAIGLARNRWALWATPRVFSLLEAQIEKLERWCFPGWEGMSLGEEY